MENRFLEFDVGKVRELTNSMHKDELIEFFGFIMEHIDLDASVSIDKDFRYKKNWEPIKISSFKSSVINILTLSKYRAKIFMILNSDTETSLLYHYLTWEDLTMWFDEDGLKKFELEEFPEEGKRSGEKIKKLPNKRGLIKQRALFDYRGKIKEFLYIQPATRALLRYIIELPKEYDIVASNPSECEYHYSNESGVFSFFQTFYEMCKSRLLEFGKNSDKPLAKTLNILKSSTDTQEFFEAKPHNIIATDMLTRSFWNALSSRGFEFFDDASAIKAFIENKMRNKYDFFIARFFCTHLKGVRFDPINFSESGLFDAANTIIKNLPQDGWVSVYDLILFCKYRDLFFYYEGRYKTENYEFDGVFTYPDGKKQEGVFDVRDGYLSLFAVPNLKGLLFYFGALGVLELKYNTPKSECNFTLKGKSYVSIWDSLEYIKLSEFGKYVFGFSKNYIPKIVKTSKKALKFDEFKPIITLDPKDSITIAKLDGYCDKIDEGRYILSYAKIFRDCNNYKTLEIKIDNFYKIFSDEIPAIFREFLKEIKERANLLHRDLKMVTIELDEQRELLNLFATNKKLQELIIKAQGYRVLIKKDDIPKMRKILGDNGFFVDF